MLTRMPWRRCGRTPEPVGLNTSPSRPVTASAILLTRTPSKIGSSDIGKNGTRDQSRNWSIARQSGITHLGRRTPRAVSTCWLDTKSTWIANWNGHCRR